MRSIVLVAALLLGAASAVQQPQQQAAAPGGEAGKQAGPGQCVDFESCIALVCTKRVECSCADAQQGFDACVGERRRFYQNMANTWAQGNYAGEDGNAGATYSAIISG